jgi:hypothetical protein
MVPSQTGGHAPYEVSPDPHQPHCTCPDHETNGVKCKHIFAVEYTIEREQTPDGETVVTESFKVTRKTYSQDWPAYNLAQTTEKDRFQVLLHDLCCKLPEPERPGRNSILEPLTSAHRQRLTPPARPRQAELQLEPANRLPRNNGRRTKTPSTDDDVTTTPTTTSTDSTTTLSDQ